MGTGDPSFDKQFTITGTGFTPTTTGYIYNVGTGAVGQIAYVSSTSMVATFTATSLTTGLASNDEGLALDLTDIPAEGASILSQDYYMTVSSNPVVWGVYNVTSSGKADLTSPASVGAGAVNFPVAIAVEYLQAGATVTAPVDPNGVADSGVTITVTSVAPTAFDSYDGYIYANVSVAASDTNVSDGFTVTNPDGGVTSTTSYSSEEAVTSIVINAGPTIKSVTPASVSASSTAALTLTGTNFVDGASASVAGGLCGSVTVVSSTQATVSCAFPSAGTTGVSVVYTNPDGGQATSPVLLPAVVPTVVATVNVSFAKNSAALTAAAKASLFTLASQWTDGAKVVVTANGATKALATARAKAVKAFIVNAAAVHVTTATKVSKSNKASIATTSN